MTQLLSKLKKGAKELEHGWNYGVDKVEHTAKDIKKDLGLTKKNLKRKFSDFEDDVEEGASKLPGYALDVVETLNPIYDMADSFSDNPSNFIASGMKKGRQLFKSDVVDKVVPNIDADIEAAKHAAEVAGLVVLGGLGLLLYFSWENKESIYKVGKNIAKTGINVALPETLLL